MDGNLDFMLLLIGSRINIFMEQENHFLFTFKNTEEDLKVFRWTGANDNIQYSNSDSIAMGGDVGKFAIYLRNNFYNGSSHRWATFDNDVLSSEEEFEWVKFEVWGFDCY